MSIQIHRKRRTSKTKGRKQWIPDFPWWLWLIMIIDLFAVIAFILIGVWIWKTQTDIESVNNLTRLSILFSIPLTLLNVFIGVLGWKRPPTIVPPTHIPLSKQYDTNNKISSYIETIPFPTLNTSTLDREKMIKEIFHAFINENSSIVILTGVFGIGKSYLANLLYQNVETLLKHDKRQFTEKPIWIKFNPESATSSFSFTITNIANKIAKDLDESLPENFESFSISDQAAMLADIMRDSKPRLIILDQLDTLLDWQTGQVLNNCIGIGKWLEKLSSVPCKCKVLITSCFCPRELNATFSSFVKEYPIEGLDMSEGIELLQKLRVSATSEELQRIVEMYEGHPYALTIFASHLKPYQSVNVFLNEPFCVQAQQCREEIAHKCLANINVQLTETQYKLLKAFSIYREEVPQIAAEALLEVSAPARNEVGRALDVLTARYLLHLHIYDGEVKYKPHAIVLGYMLDHYLEGDKVGVSRDEQNRTALKIAHIKAAQYYRDHITSLEGSHAKSNMKLTIEAAWHECQAGRDEEAYLLVKKENLLKYLL